MQTKDEYKNLSKNLGKRIKEFRQLKHMTGDKFSEMVGISPTFLWDLENGNKKPSVNTLVKIANVLECSLDSLLCDTLESTTLPQLNNITKKLEKLNKEQLKMIELTVDSMLEAFKGV